MTLETRLAMTQPYAVEAIGPFDTENFIGV